MRRGSAGTEAGRFGPRAPTALLLEGVAEAEEDYVGVFLWELV